ncbi:MAG: protoporphyrinogen oxidase [Tumebacillaceae bacterium]
MQQDGNAKTVVVIGGGITGLSTAYYLEKKAREQGEAVRIVLVEAEDKLGGKVQTERVDGFVIERGPDSFLARKPAAVNLCRELGIDDELVGTNPQAKKTYILHQNKLHRIPQGLNIGVPTQFSPFVKTKLLSLGGKIRAGLDLLMKPETHTEDRSIGQLLEKHLGKEVVDNMAEPLLAGIYAGDLRKLSVRATFPQMEHFEQKYGSLVRGMLTQAAQAKAQARQAQSKLGEPGSAKARPLPNSVFLTFRGGLVRMIDGIAAALQSTDVRLSTKVVSVTPGESGYELLLGDGELLRADSVVMTTPNYDAAQVLPAELRSQAYLLNVPYASVATVVLAYQKGAFEFDLDASGFVVPRKEGRTITACTWTSSKWQHTASDGNVLLRFYVGRSGDEAIVDESDEEIVRRVRKDMLEVMGLDAEPKFTRVTRWRRAMPQYAVGHLDRVREFVEQVGQELPGVFFAGAGFTGLGIPDCIDQGIKTADGVLAFLKQNVKAVVSAQ